MGFRSLKVELQSLFPMLLVSGSAWILMTNYVIAEEIKIEQAQVGNIHQKAIATPTQLAQSPTTPASAVEITEVEINSTEQGIELILQAPNSQKLQVVNRTAGNSFIADVQNAKLRLPSGTQFNSCTWYYCCCC